MGSTKQDVKSAGASSQPQCLLDQGHEPPRSIMEYATLHSQGRVYTCHGLTVRSAIILAFICGCSLGCRKVASTRGMAPTPAVQVAILEEFATLKEAFTRMDGGCDTRSYSDLGGLRMEFNFSPGVQSQKLLSDLSISNASPMFKILRSEEFQADISDYEFVKRIVIRRALILDRDKGLTRGFLVN